MLRLLLVGASLLTATSLAEEPDATAQVDAEIEPDARTQAEYRRLSDELSKLTEKQIWVGAERTYQQLEALGLELSFDDHVAGAHSARQAGEIGLTYDRLTAAARLQPDREVVEWLWTLDQEYGRVVLRVEPPGEAPFQAARVPFAPDARRCIEVAGEHLSSAGRFEGMLPVGGYQLGGQEFTVSPGRVAVEITVAPSEGGRRWGRGRAEDEGSGPTP